MNFFLKISAHHMSSFLMVASFQEQILILMLIKFISFDVLYLFHQCNIYLRMPFQRRKIIIFPCYHIQCVQQNQNILIPKRKYQNPQQEVSFKEQTLNLMPVAGPSVQNSNMKPLILGKKKQKQVKIDTLLFKKLKGEKIVPFTPFTATASVEDPSIQCDTCRASAPEEEDTSRKALFTTNHQALITNQQRPLFLS